MIIISNFFMLKNFFNLFKSPISITIWIISSILFWLLVEKFSNRALIKWNQWIVWANINFFLDMTNAVLIWIFIASFFYKYTKFWEKRSWTWIFWGLLASLMTGCWSCSITLATYLWLSSIFLAMPFWWLEVKAISTIILLYSVYKNLKNLETCQLKFKKI